jgi:hypothetical protein
MPLDMTESFASVPTESDLRTMAQDWLNRSSLGIPRVSIEVSYVEDSDIATPLYLCDTVKVVFEPLGISTLAKVTEVKWNVLLDRYESAVIGLQFEDVAGTVLTVEKAAVNQAVQQAAKQTQQAVKTSEAKTQDKIDQITYDYVTPQTKETGSIADTESKVVMATYFKLEQSAKARFCATVNFHITETVPGTPATLTVLYGVDGTQQTALHQDYYEGDHILTLDFLTGNLAAGDHVIGVAFGMVGGALS